MSERCDIEPSFLSALNTCKTTFAKTENNTDSTLRTRNELLFDVWTYFTKDASSQATESGQSNILELIRLHQKHVINPSWVEDSNQDWRIRLIGVLKLASLKVKETISRQAYQEFLALLELSKEPWTGPLLLPILAGKPETRSIDYLIGESYEVCAHRLRLLLEGQTLQVAFNFSEFLVSSVFDPEKLISSLVVQRWLAEAKDVSILLDIHIGLMFRLKKSSFLVDRALNSLRTEDLVGAAERLLRNSHGSEKCPQSHLDAVFDEKTLAKASEKLMELAMRLAAEQTLETSILERIIMNWLNRFDDPRNPALELHAEKFADLGAKTGLGYNIAFHIHHKFGSSARPLVVDITIRALCADINRLDVARTGKDQQSIIRKEKTMSKGLVLLAKILEDNLTINRECILTAFSLTPTKELFQKVFDLAKRSELTESRLSNTETPESEEAKRLQREVVPINFLPLDFDEICELEEAALAKGYSHGRCFRTASQQKCKRNLEGLISVQGNVFAEAANYDPIEIPLQTATPEVLGLPKQLVADLLVVIESPRWHLLSWVLDWPTLKERCQRLMSNPKLKNPLQELKYLVVNYTQFDGWSSDEEITTTGIETGYEHWEKADESVLEDSPVENGDQSSETENDESDFEILPEQYLPKRRKDHTGKTNSPLNETTHATHSTLTESGPASRGPLHDKDPNSDEVREKLKLLVPGLESSINLCLQGSFSEMDVGLALVDFDVSPRHRNESYATSEFVREKLKQLVPGLTDFSFWEPGGNFQHESIVGVVHVTLANSSTGPSQSIPAMENRTAARKVVLASTSQTPDGSLAATNSQSLPTISSKKETERETKVQYVYKHGTQTIVVDRPLSEGELSKLKFPLTSNNVQLQQHPTAASSLQNKQVITIARPAIPSQSVSQLNVSPSASTQNSVESLANTLISQIQTPVQLTSNGQPIKSEDAKPPLGALPKFQFAFGSRESNCAPVIKSEPGLVIVKTEPTETPNGKLMQATASQAIQNSVASAGLKGSNLISHPSKSGAQIIVHNAAISQSPVLPGQATLQASPSAASHADLIKQLNQARAQGLVVLQQWGDKQVLVHKATGRWIMRQGHRLVTVPPQALGIQAATGTAQTGTNPTASSSSMSSSTMEQLREFDSILESKFKTSVPGVQLGNESLQTAPTSGSSPATFVIIASQQQQVSSLIKCEPNDDFNRIKTTTTSTSAPTSPAKPIKVPSMSVSASVSPIGSAINSTLGFAKPSPKPQEDPDTLKRIQQILDDYNEQIRNSPDLQNRPAPRRRTNGPIVNSGSSDSVKRKRLSSVSPPPSNSAENFDAGSPTVVQVSPASTVDPGLMTLKVIHKLSSENGDEAPATSTANPSYSVVRQIIVPSSLAASLQNCGRQIMVVTGPNGKKMVALKPVYTGPGSTNLAGKFSTLASGPLPARLISSSSMTSSASSSNSSSPDIPAKHCSDAIAGQKSAQPTDVDSMMSTPTPSSSVTTREDASLKSTFLTASHLSNVFKPRTGHASSPSIILSNERASPNLVLQSIVCEERPASPSLGIPMEMTPGQIMEAEISAATLLDDSPDSPFALMSSASSSSLRHRKHEDEESLSETLPENLFTQDLPSTSSDDDEYRSDMYEISTSSYAKRKRHASSTSSSEELSTQLQKRPRLDEMNSRHRSISQSKSKKSSMGFFDTSHLINH